MQRQTHMKPAPWHLGSGGFASLNKDLASASDMVQVPHVTQRNFILQHSYFHFKQVYGDILTATTFTTHTERFGTKDIGEWLLATVFNSYTLVSIA